PGEGRTRGRGADRAPGVDVAQPSGDLPRPPRVPRPQAGLRSMRAGQGLSVVRRRSHRPTHRRAAGKGSRDRTPAGTGRAVNRPAWHMSTSTRWTVAVMVIVVALGVALWQQLGDDAAPSGSRAPAPARDHRDADTVEALAGPRAGADLEPCPPPGTGAGPAALHG